SGATGRPAGHQEGRSGPAHFPAGRLGGGEGRGARREMLGTGGERGQAAEVRKVAGLREQPAIRDAALLRSVGARHLSRSVFFPGTTAEAHSRPLSFPRLDPPLLSPPFIERSVNV